MGRLFETGFRGLSLSPVTYHMGDVMLNVLMKVMV